MADPGTATPVARFSGSLAAGCCCRPAATPRMGREFKRTFFLPKAPVRIFSITGRSMMAAMIFSRPPQFGQSAMSISTTRFSSLAQLSRTGWWCALGAAHSAGGQACTGGSGSCGTTCACNLALPARTRNAVVRAAKVRSLREAKLRGHQTNQVQSGAWHQRSQPLHELQRRHHEVRDAVSPRGLELEHHLTRGVGLHALVGQGGARDVAAQLLQRLAVVGAAAHGCVLRCCRRCRRTAAA